MTARNSGPNRETLAELWQDIGSLPDYLAQSNPPAAFLWLGPAGTMTPLHHDLTNNLMAQVVGRKRVWIAPTIYQPHLYNYLRVFSRVDLSCIDYAQFPEMRHVRVLECILYQIPEEMTLEGFPNQLWSDSKWRTKEVRHADCFAR